MGDRYRRYVQEANRRYDEEAEREGERRSHSPRHSSSPSNRVRVRNQPSGYEEYVGYQPPTSSRGYGTHLTPSSAAAPVYGQQASTYGSTGYGQQTSEYFSLGYGQQTTAPSSSTTTGIFDPIRGETRPLPPTPRYDTVRGRYVDAPSGPVPSAPWTSASRTLGSSQAPSIGSTSSSHVPYSPATSQNFNIDPGAGREQDSAGRYVRAGQGILYTPRKKTTEKFKEAAPGTGDFGVFSTHRSEASRSSRPTFQGSHALRSPKDRMASLFKRSQTYKKKKEAQLAASAAAAPAYTAPVPAPLAPRPLAPRPLAPYPPGSGTGQSYSRAGPVSGTWGLSGQPRHRSRSEEEEEEEEEKRSHLRRR
ncbi:hypothetical protein BDV96DRAFT_647012 [Lophiotrema nucula]|uniref:Uncharacterized protein n=1 Tax=Lophiotrema nucula TaxID=690887 RepID=A0A6A5Z5B8_9PLEO|nr:hypothetical protein BDV96DRAFT_647012 [Lophiotrema nucula]